MAVQRMARAAGSVAVAVAVAGAGPLATSAAQAAWPGHNGAIAFESRTSGGDEDIWTLAGGTLTNLTHKADVNDLTPSYSPNGSKIAWSRFGAIYAMNADGTGKTGLATAAEGDLAPSWSPDGKQIVFVQGGQLWVMNSDGTNMHVLELAGSNPSWSPDGHWIAFDAYSSIDNRSNIYKVHPNGAGLTILTIGIGIGSDTDPDWAPDGSRIVFTNQPQSGVTNIDRMWPDGSHRTKLVSQGRDYEPAYSPNGEFVAYVEDASDGLSSDIWRVRISTGARVNLTNSADTFEDAPTWQPT